MFQHPSERTLHSMNSIPPALPQGLGQMFQPRSWIVFPRLHRQSLFAGCCVDHQTYYKNVFNHNPIPTLGSPSCKCENPCHGVIYWWTQFHGGFLLEACWRSLESHCLSVRNSSIPTVHDWMNNFWAISIAEKKMMFCSSPWMPLMYLACCPRSFRLKQHWTWKLMISNFKLSSSVP